METLRANSKMQLKRGFDIDFNRLLNSQNLYLLILCQSKTKNNSSFLLTIAILEHQNC